MKGEFLLFVWKCPLFPFNPCTHDCITFHSLAIECYLDYFRGLRGRVSLGSDVGEIGLVTSAAAMVLGRGLELQGLPASTGAAIPVGVHHSISALGRSRFRV